MGDTVVDDRTTADKIESRECALWHMLNYSYVRIMTKLSHMNVHYMAHADDIRVVQLLYNPFYAHSYVHVNRTNFVGEFFSLKY